MRLQGKQRFFWTAVFTFLLAAFSLIPVRAAQTVTVNTEILNVRSGPDIASEKISQVKAGAQFAVLQEKNGWVQIQLAPGKTGWIRGDFVRDLPAAPDDPESDFTPREGIITGSIVNVRLGPGTTFSKVGSCVKDTRVAVAEAKGDWYRVTLKNGGTGWVAAWLVKLSDQPVSSPTGQASDHPVLPETKDAPGDGAQSISWDWKKAGTGVRIAVQGSKPLGYGEKGPDNQSRIVFQIAASSEKAYGTEKVNYGGVREIKTGQGKNDITIMEIFLDGEVPYQTALNSDGRILTIEINHLGMGGKTVVIDPGHGSCKSGTGAADPGAIGPSGLYESEVVLDLGKKVEALLNEQGVRVIMTRKGETNLSLEERAKLANDSGADAFVSIHVNASPSSALKGTSTYFYAPLGSSLEAQRTARQSLAQSVQEKLLQQLGRNNLGVREENFAVLRYTTVPSILIETAFISNPEEEILLADDQFRSQAAAAIVDGLETYFAGGN